MPEPTVETSLARIQTDPATGVAQAFFEQKTTFNGLEFQAPWTNVTWSLEDPDKFVEVDGIRLTYAQVSRAVVAIAYQEKDTLLPQVVE
jgi:hypothetical protein